MGSGWAELCSGMMGGAMRQEHGWSYVAGMLAELCSRRVGGAMLQEDGRSYAAGQVKLQVSIHHWVEVVPLNELYNFPQSVCLFCILYGS